MKTTILIRMNRQKTVIMSCLLALSTSLFAQQLPDPKQLPDPSFENWGSSFNGDAQLVNWNGSNVTQAGFKFTFLYSDAGRTGGKCARIADKEVGAAGITEPAPGYMALGQPWSYLESITKIGEATAGTDGGISFKFRPDTMAIWIKRTGSNTDKEYYNVLFYSWKGNSIGTSYTGKNGGCTSTMHTNEESDIRQALNGNTCNTSTFANQIAEGWVKEKKTYGDWTRIKVPIYYINDEIPSMCNVILSAGNYPNFRANSGLYPGNTLYVDDIELIYSSAINELYVNNKKWAGFDPNLNHGEEQTYALGLGVTTVPTISGKRGSGSITNCKGTSASFTGRTLSGNEITITNATEVGGTAGKNITTIVVKAEDDSSTSTYKIKFVAEQSTNCRPSNITYNVAGTTTSVPNFSGFVTSYNIELPYGTAAIPTIEAIKGDDGQEFVYTQPTTLPGTATVTSTAADNNYSATYTINFSVGQLDDNKLTDIKIGGNSLPGFSPTKTNYTVEMPLGTTALPVIEPISAYAEGVQTITTENTVVISGETCTGTYTISVKAPGNATIRTYKLSFKITASTYSYLKDIKIGGTSMEGFDPTTLTYSYVLPQGTTTLPTIEAVKGDAYQQTPVIETGGVDGVTKITVTAASGAQSIYRITFSSPKSSNASLQDLKVNGTTIPNFDTNTLTYNYEFPIGTTNSPTVTYTAGDAYQTITKIDGGLTGSTRIIVQAQNGSVKTYVINFSVARADNTTLLDIKVGGTSIPNFDPETYNYDYKLERGTTTLPAITYTAHDDFQTITMRNGGIDGETKIIVKSQVGTSATYVITFSVDISSNALLQGIFINGTALEGFSANEFTYSYELPIGTTTLPAITWSAGDAYQTITKTDGGISGTSSIVVRSEDGTKTNTYRITFSVAQADNATLKDIQIDGVSIAEFQSNTLEYSILLERGTTTLPAITYTAHDEWQKVRVVSAGVSGDTRITVTAQTGATETYIIHFSVDKSTNCQLSDIQIGGTSLTDFNTTKFNYNFTLKSGTATLPDITYIKGDEAQKVILTKGSINGATTLRIIAESGAEATYTINFSVEKSENAFLKNIFINDVAISGFDKNIFNYTYRLKADEITCPKISVEKELGQRVSISKPMLTGEVRIVVTPESGGSNTYIINVMLDLSDNTTLNTLQVDGQLIAGFSAEKLEYTYDLPTGTQVLPTVTYTASEASQQIAITKGDTTYVRVEAADGSERIYTIYFNKEKSNNAQLADLKVNGVSLANFNANTLEYNYELTRGTTMCPSVEAVKGDTTQDVSILTPKLEGDCDIRVVSETGIETIYTIRFLFNQSTISTLAKLKIDGSDILENGKLDYTFQLAPGTTGLPTIDYEKGDAQQVVTILNNGINGKTSLIVKAENGDLTTYTINFDVIKSNAAKLQSLKLDGVELAEFNPYTFSYVHTLAFGTLHAPIITAVGTEPTQQILITDAPALEGTAHVKVVAQDGTTVTYTVTFAFAPQTNVTLKDIAVNGVSISGSDPNQTDYTINLASGETAPKITYEAYDTTQVIAVADAGLNGVKIVVAAQNGDQRVYDIKFNMLPSTNALLTDLQLYNGNEFKSLTEFDANTLEYTHLLEWRTKSVPAIYPISAHTGQTVTITYGAINDTTRVHVVAQDGVTFKDYAIYFPVITSNIATLSDLSIDDAELSPAFESTQFNYVATLNYGTTSIPAIRWSQGEDFGKQLIEQQIKIVAPSLHDTTHVVVTAEDGTQKVYNITFVIRESGKPNVLQSIFVDKYHFEGTTSQTDFNVELPYGATTMSDIKVVKNYPEQSVLIDNGGAYAPTTITVKSNQKDVADAIYTLTPTIAKPQAVLASINVNGNPISDFNPYKYQYIVNVANTEGEVPTLEYTNNNMTSAIEDFASGVKSATITVTGKDDNSSNTYKIIYYYTSDILPNGEFTNWSIAATYTSAKKPTGWSTIADVVGATEIKSNATIFGLPIGSLFTVGTYKPDGAVTQSGDKVRLRTIYDSSLKGSIPGLITLGEITAKLGMEATTTDVAGGILFRNTPDMVSMRYQPVSKSNVTSSHFVYSLNNGAYKKEFTDNNFNNTWKIIDLPLLDNSVEAPAMMNIIINSCEAENSSSLSSNAASEMNVDWIRLSYNSKIAKILVNGKATKGFRGQYDGGWVQAVTVDTDLQGEPTLSFVGEVADQEYSYYFDEEVENCSGSKTRVAYITSKAEDGTLSHYIVNLNRQLSANANLTSIIVNDQVVASFAPNKTTYTVVTNPLYVPDVTAVRGNMYQTITYDSISNELAIIKVKAENGTEKTYTLHFVKALGSDATLKNIAVEGTTDFAFAPDTINYVVKLPAEAGLPNVTFAKQSDGQLVTMVVDTITTLVTTAENGTDTKTYTITFELGNASTTSGKLTEIKIDGIPVTGFNKDNANYESAKRAAVDFVREFTTDTVEQVITNDSILWQVSGTEHHQYKLSFTKALSNSVLLKTILVRNDTLNLFNSYEKNYEITSATIENMQAVYAEEGQVIDAQFELGDSDYLGTFKFIITAADGVTKDSTMVRVKRLKSNNGKLNAILLNDELIRINGTGYNSTSDFNADNTTYTITLPCTNPKLANPKMPNIEAIAGANGQHISIEQNGINATSYIVVTPEDGSVENEMSYELTVVVAKSNNNKLSNIVVNGDAVADFQADKFTYTVDLANNNVPTVEFVKEDQFATVTPLVSQDSALLIVKAEDGTEQTYRVQFNIAPISNNAQLSDLKVNGTTVSGFSASELNYNLTLAQGTTTVPSIEAFKAHDGQTLDIVKNGVNDTTFITVTAEDGVTTQTYKIAFSVTKSHNADLAGISVNFQPISFVASDLRYHVVLPTTMTPNVIGVKAESVQRIDKTIYGTDSVYLKVTAEDGITTKTYIVTFEVQAAQNAYLGGLLLNDVTIAGFDSNLLNYVVILPAGSIETPEVTAISGSNGQNIIITNNGVRDTTTIVVTAQDGITSLTYTVYFDVELSDIDTLSMINLDGEPLVSFDANTLVYNITLPVGTRTYPAITWEKGNLMEYTALDTLNLTKYDAAFNVRVESEKFHASGSGNSRTYRVNFTIEKSAVDTLAMIYVKGDSVDAFRGNTLQYAMVLPVGTRVVPTIEYTAADTLQTIVVEPVDVDLSDYVAQTNIKVTAENGNQNVYELHFTVAKSTIDTLKNLTINGLSIATTGSNYTSDKAFAGNTFEYHVQWAIGSAKNPLPEIEFEVGDTLQTVQPQSITVSSLSDTISIVVKAENGNSNTYTIYQQLLHSEVDTLAMIYVNDAQVSTFNADTLTYNLTLPVGTRVLPKIEFDKGDAWQTAVLNTVSTDKYASTFEINVTAESGKQRTYTLYFTVAKSTADTLSMITIDGLPLAGFNPQVGSYNYTLPIGTSELPIIAYELGDSLQTVGVTSNGVNGAYNITVTAENGTQNVYVINFTVAKSNNAYLNNIFYNTTQAVDNFDAELFNYTIKLPYTTGTVQVPEITVEKGDAGQSVQIIQAATLNDTVIITVTAEDNVATATYRVAFELLKSNNALLNMIYLNDEKLDSVAQGFTTSSNFIPESFEYAIELPFGTTTLPTITWEGQVPNYKSISMETNGIGGTTIITVVSDDESNTNEYNLTFSVAKSSNNKLADLLVSGVTIDGFNPDTLGYTIVYPIGTDSATLITVANVTYLAGDGVQTVVISQPEPTLILVTVTAEDGANQVYIIHLEIARSNNSLLKDIKLDGVSLKDFESTIFEYTFLLFNGRSIPEIEAIKSEESQTTQITINPVGELTYIFVTAEDGTESVYTIDFRYSSLNPGDKPTKEDVYWMPLGNGTYKASTSRNNVKVAIFTASGQLIAMRNLPTADPNDNIKEAGSAGTIFNYQKSGKVYIYVFYFNDKNIITQGKFMY